MRVQEKVVVLQRQQSLSKSSDDAKKNIIMKKCFVNFKTKHEKRQLKLAI